jgi:hypothetical protein
MQTLVAAGAQAAGLAVRALAAAWEATLHLVPVAPACLQASAAVVAAAVIAPILVLAVLAVPGILSFLIYSPRLLSVTLKLTERIKMQKSFAYFLAFALGAFFFTSVAAFAADPVPMSDGDFFAQVFQTIGNFGGLSWIGKVSSIVMLLIAFTKTPLWKDKVFGKIPAGLRPFLAPSLGLIGGLLSIHPLTFASAFAYVGAGAGAIILYELLDGVKATYATSAAVTAIISFIQGLLKTGK